MLLRSHRHRLRIEDLEDCYSQATLELIQRAQTGVPFATTAHIAHSVEQKFLSRIHDRRRALAGRSPIEAALGQAAPLEPRDTGGQFADPGPGVVDQVAMRAELGVLREIARELTPDMRLVLSHQVGLGMECQAFCQRFDWSPEKFRKVAQRARQKLWALSHEYAVGDRCRRLEPDLLAYISRVADPDERERAQMHLENCTACRRRVRDLRARERGVLGLLPGGLEAGAVGLAGGAAGSVASGGGVAAGGGFVAWGGSGLIGTKLGVVAVCLASLAGGGYALCRDGQLPSVVGSHRPVERPAVRLVARRPVLRLAAPATLEPLARTWSATSPDLPIAISATGSRAGIQLNKTSPTRVAESAVTREFGFAALSAVEAPTAKIDGHVATVRRGARPAAHRRRPRRHREFVPVITSTTRPASAAPATLSSAAPPRPPAATGPPPSRPPARPSGSSSAGGEFGFESG